MEVVKVTAEDFRKLADKIESGEVSGFLRIGEENKLTNLFAEKKEKELNIHAEWPRQRHI